MREFVSEGVSERDSDGDFGVVATADMIKAETFARGPIGE